MSDSINVSKVEQRLNGHHCSLGFYENEPSGRIKQKVSHAILNDESSMAITRLVMAECARIVLSDEFELEVRRKLEKSNDLTDAIETAVAKCMWR